MVVDEYYSAETSLPLTRGTGTFGISFAKLLSYKQFPKTLPKLRRALFTPSVTASFLHYERSIRMISWCKGTGHSPYQVQHLFVLHFLSYHTRHPRGRPRLAKPPERWLSHQWRKIAFPGCGRSGFVALSCVRAASSLRVRT